MTKSALYLPLSSAGSLWRIQGGQRAELAAAPHSHLAFFARHFYSRHLYVGPPYENPGSAPALKSRMEDNSYPNVCTFWSFNTLLWAHYIYESIHFICIL